MNLGYRTVAEKVTDVVGLVILLIL